MHDEYVRFHNILGGKFFLTNITFECFRHMRLEMMLQHSFRHEFFITFFASEIYKFYRSKRLGKNVFKLLDLAHLNMSGFK